MKYSQHQVCNLFLAVFLQSVSAFKIPGLSTIYGNQNSKSQTAPKIDDYTGQLFIIKESVKGDIYDAFVTTGGIQKWNPMAKKNVANERNEQETITEDPEYAGVIINSETVKQLNLFDSLQTNISLSTLLKVAVSRMPWLLVLHRKNHQSLSIQSDETLSLRRKSFNPVHRQRRSATDPQPDLNSPPLEFPNANVHSVVGNNPSILGFRNQPPVYSPGDVVPEANYMPLEFPADISNSLNSKQPTSSGSVGFKSKMNIKTSINPSSRFLSIFPNLNAIRDSSSLLDFPTINAKIEIDSPPSVFPVETSHFLVGTHPSEFPIGSTIEFEQPPIVFPSKAADLKFHSPPSIYIAKEKSDYFLNPSSKSTLPSGIAIQFGRPPSIFSNRPTDFQFRSSPQIFPTGMADPQSGPFPPVINGKIDNFKDNYADDLIQDVPTVMKPKN